MDDTFRIIKYIKKKQSSNSGKTTKFNLLLLTSTVNDKVSSFILKTVPDGAKCFISDHTQLAPALVWGYQIEGSDACAQINSC